MTAPICIANAQLSAEIDPIGAELHRLCDEAGRDLLWNGDPAFWTGRAPLLFPVVGAVNGDAIRINGVVYPMARHGFARRLAFTPVDQQPDRAAFRLEDNAETRVHYPFAFRFDVTFVLDGRALAIEAVLSNPNAAPLPASFGFHPALRWPLPWGGARDDHRLVFARNEPAPIRRLDPAHGLVLPEPQPTPVVGDVLVPHDDLFARDALIFDRLESRRISYGVPGGRMIELAFPDMPLLGIWTKAGAPFLCIEPWHGLADPMGYDGDFRDKPYVVQVPPAGEERFAMTITLDPPPAGS